MKSELIAKLACPVCQAPMEIESRHVVFEIRGTEHIDEGVLICSRQHRFPVIGEVARLVPPEDFSHDEREALRRRPRAGSPRRITPDFVDDLSAACRIRETIGMQYDQTDAASARRGLAHATYMAAEFDGRNKQKFARLLATLGVRPTTILDVGGSSPGFLRCLGDQFQPRLKVVADLGIEHAETFKSLRRDIALIRARAECLPFKPKSFDLVVSAFLLEHVSNWKKAIESMASAGNELFISYGPNRWFPFELGHLNAPLAGTLPKPLAKYAAYLWLNATGDRRSLKSIERILEGMSYFSSRAFRRHCRHLGLEPVNLFARLTDQILTHPVKNSSVVSETAPALPGSLLRIARSFPGTAAQLAKILEGTGFEPQVYCFLPAARRPRTPQDLTLRNL